jgi:long-chain acyl-CoA synthetase
VHACVVLRPGASVSEDELIAHCLQELASMKKPRSFEFRDSLPRNALGKVAKAELRAPHWTEQDAAV